MVLRRIKRALHREIVADPVLHGRVLNLYLNGEQYPHRVADYFPMATVEDAALERRMREHLREEDKHVALYTKAIDALEQPVRELPLQDVYNSVIRRNTPAEPADSGRLALANFLAHLHWLETRVAQSLEYHLDACAHAADPYPAKAVQVILHDERAHAVYTREAVFSIVPRTVARQVLETHRRAEARANREFSARELKRLLREEGGRFRRRHRVFFGCCAELLERGASHG